MNVSKIVTLSKSIRSHLAYMHYYFSPGDREATLGIVDRIQTEVLESDHSGGSELIDFGKALAGLRTALQILSPRPDTKDKSNLAQALDNFWRALTRIEFQEKGITTYGSWLKSLEEKEKIPTQEIDVIDLKGG